MHIIPSRGPLWIQVWLKIFYSSSMDWRPASMWNQDHLEVFWVSMKKYLLLLFSEYRVFLISFWIKDLLKAYSSMRSFAFSSWWLSSVFLFLWIKYNTFYNFYVNRKGSLYRKKSFYIFLVVWRSSSGTLWIKRFSMNSLYKILGLEALVRLFLIKDFKNSYMGR